MGGSSATNAHKESWKEKYKHDISYVEKLSPGSNVEDKLHVLQDCNNQWTLSLTSTTGAFEPAGRVQEQREKKNYRSIDLYKIIDFATDRHDAWCNPSV